MIHSTWLRLAALAALALPALADQASKQALIDEMLTLTKADSLIQSVIDQQQTALQQKLKQIVDSDAQLQPYAKDLEPVLAEFERKTIDLLRNGLNWTTLKPQISVIYGDVLTEEELAGAVAFYKTPAGQSLLKKMPDLMNASMKLMQQKLEVLLPEINRMGPELSEKIAKITANQAR
jgi:hypothetical protein